MFAQVIKLTEELRANRGEKLMALMQGEPYKLVFDATTLSHLNVRQLMMQAREAALETPYLCKDGLSALLNTKNSRSNKSRGSAVERKRRRIGDLLITGAAAVSTHRG